MPTLDDYLSGGPLDGAVTFLVSQRDPVTGHWRRRRLSLSDLVAYVLVGQAERDTAQDAALAVERTARADADSAETRARAGADTAEAARLAALEMRPEEVVPFSAALATGVLAVGTKTFTLAVPGVLASDRVVVGAAAALPAGLAIAGARVPAAGSVEVTLQAAAALTASKTIALLITALR